MKDVPHASKLGFVHHMLYPSFIQSARAHVDTLVALSRREDVGCMDLCLQTDGGARAEAIRALRGCGKQITYVNHLFPARKISLGTADAAERWIIRSFLTREADAAAEIGASQFLFVSGADVPGDRENAVKRFGEIAVWFCGLLAERGIEGVIEPLDTGVDKRFLIGSTEESCRLVESLGLPNLGLEVDLGHIPCLFETFEASYRRAKACLRRVHLSSCVLTNPADPMFGDRHPSFFHPGGHLSEDDLARVLRVLCEIGYFEEGDDRRLLFEVNPLPGEDADDCVRAHRALFASAWMRA